MSIKQSKYQEPPNRLREFRIQMGLTIAEVARRSSIAASTVRKMEQRQITKVEMKYRVANSLKIAASELFPSEKEIVKVANSKSKRSA